jgi:hypothetical protein
MKGALLSPGFYLGAGVTLVYIPNLTGSGVLTGWPFLAAFLAVFLPWRKVAMSTSLNLLGLGFLAWAGLSLAWTENIYDGIGALANWIILGMAYYYGSSIARSEHVYFGFCVGVTICVAVAASQSLGYDPIGATDDFRSNVSGLYVNSTIFGAVVALALTSALFGGMWWFVPIGMLGLYLSGARGPAIAFLLIALIGVWKWSRGLALILCVPAALYAGAVFLQKNDLTHTTTLRVAYWLDTAEALTWRGAGVGSFFQSYPDLAKRTDVVKSRPEHPYSDPLEIVFELGVGSLLLWTLLILLLEVPLADRYILGTFLLISLSYFPLAFPPCAFIAAFAAGRLARGWVMVRRGEPLSRPAVPYWLEGQGYTTSGAFGGFVPVQPINPNPAGVYGDVPGPIPGHSPSPYIHPIERSKLGRLGARLAPPQTGD